MIKCKYNEVNQIDARLIATDQEILTDFKELEIALSELYIIWKGDDADTFASRTAKNFGIIKKDCSQLFDCHKLINKRERLYSLKNEKFQSDSKSILARVEI